MRSNTLKALVSAAIAVFMAATAVAQSASEIKSNPDYLCGEGRGTTLRQADNEALSDLTSRISVTIGDRRKIDTHNSEGAAGVQTTVNFNQVLETYSQATLTNTQRLIVSDEPKAHVLRYIRKSEIDRIFEGRKAKVLDMVGLAEKAEKKAKIDDALRYYYWAYELLKSLQRPNEVSYTCPDGQQRLLYAYIPDRMNDIFSSIDVQCSSINDTEAELYITYNGRPVTSFDYTYFDGMDWGNICSAKDGKGIIDLRPGYPADRLKLKCEYAFESETHIDRDVEAVMKVVDANSFSKATMFVETNGAQQKRQDTPDISMAQQQQPSATTPSAAGQQNFMDFLPIVQAVGKGIASHDSTSISKHFTPRGLKHFSRLIRYGNATLIGASNLTFTQLGDKVFCRGLTMSFAFRGNRRKFVENVVLTFNAAKKIDEVKFGLSKVAYDDIMNNGTWSQDARLILANFLEDYQTAYAMKDTQFVRRVFDDNAVIITGRVSQRPTVGSENSPYINNKYVKLTRQSKKEYLRNLEHCFNSNEYINLRFANNDVIRAGNSTNSGETYGIQIKQDYYSSSYGDTGYLFLMVDVNNPDNPIIKVRTWQPERDPNFGVIGIEYF